MQLYGPYENASNVLHVDQQFPHRPEQGAAVCWISNIEEERGIILQYMYLKWALLILNAYPAP